MKRNTFLSFVAIVCISLFSCSSDNDFSDDGKDPDPSENVLDLKLLVSSYNLNLFEQTELRFKVHPNGMDYTWDSLVWNIPGIFKNVSTPSHYLWLYGQSFYLPGNYEATLQLYKDGVIISADTAKIKVNLSGDFLGLSWNKEGSETVFNFLSSENNLYLNPVYKGGDSPYILLDYNVRDWVDEDEWRKRHAESRFFLYDYITGLYGKSIFNFEGEDIKQTPLVDKYNERFKTSLDSITQYSSFVPVAIWETDKSNIALVGSVKSGIETDINYYQVIAEPRKY
jgi:hypothetical protein